MLNQQPNAKTLRRRARRAAELNENIEAAFRRGVLTVERGVDSRIDRAVNIARNEMAEQLEAKQLAAAATKEQTMSVDWSKPIKLSDGHQAKFIGQAMAGLHVVEAAMSPGEHNALIYFQPDGMLAGWSGRAGSNVRVVNAPEPLTFDVGSHYRTRAGDVAIVDGVHIGGDRYPVKGSINGCDHTWTLKGCWFFDNVRQSPFDIMPGAIEVEAPQQEKLAPPATTTVFKRVAALEEKVDGALELLLPQVARLNDRAEKLERENGKLNGQLIQVAQTLERHERAIEELSVFPIVANGSNGAAIASARKVIKGGWLNVYGDGGTNLHPTRSSADSGASCSRIACIQIPDLREGQGL